MLCSQMFPNVCFMNGSCCSSVCMSTLILRSLRPKLLWANQVNIMTAGGLRSHQHKLCWSCTIFFMIFMCMWVETQSLCTGNRTQLLQVLAWLTADLSYRPIAVWRQRVMQADNRPSYRLLFLKDFNCLCHFNVEKWYKYKCWSIYISLMCKLIHYKFVTTSIWTNNNWCI